MAQPGVQDNGVIRPERPGRTRALPLAWPGLSLVWIALLTAQTPDASLRGFVTDSEGKPVAQAAVSVNEAGTGFMHQTETDSRGWYNFELLPRGLFTVKIRAEGYRAVELAGLDLSVGAKREENFALSRVTLESTAAELIGAFLSLPAPRGLPVETIASSVSVVVDENKILQLPLASRNIYSLFLLQPGVTSQGAIVRRGLSFSVHGQRVSGSNYRLDGVDNNDIVLTGPVASTSAEAIQEFRMVNSSFSAENGRATAFVAQVVTRSGTNRFTGSLFEYLGNDKLNANTFQNNAHSVEKPSLHRNQFGFSLTGPIRKNTTFFTSSLESSRLRDGINKELKLPSRLFVSTLLVGSVARRLLEQTPPITVAPDNADSAFGTIRYQVPDQIDTVLATGRLDHERANGSDRFVVRYALAFTAEQRASEFFGYPQLWPKDDFHSHNALIGWSHIFRSGPTNDLRLGWSRERTSLPRPRQEVPILLSDDGVFLPGNLRQTSERENNNVIQMSDSFSIRSGRSALMLGFDFRRNFSDGLNLGLQNEALGGVGRFPDGFYEFDNLAAFGRDQPSQFGIAIDRFSLGNLKLPDLSREYRSRDFALFIQDDLKLTRRLSLNIGVRYEYFGVPHNVDRSKDFNFYFGAGSTIEERIAHGTLRSLNQNPGDLRGLLYRRDLNNFAPSVGLAWDPLGTGRTVVRAGYAIAFDRVFDTLRDLRSNTQQVGYCLQFLDCSPRFLIPGAQMLPYLDQNLTNLGQGAIIQLDEGLRTPYAQNWFIGVQHSLAPSTLVEIGHSGSVGRKLISRDLTNREQRLINSQVGEDTFLSNAGSSSYVALEASLRRRFARGFQFQVSYTFSHAIDNQSDSFEGVRTDPAAGSFALAGFTREFDARADRGNADFDQRHNLVLNVIWNIPGPHFPVRWQNQLFQGWTVSTIGGHRSGFPVTAIGTSDLDASGLNNNRLDFVGGKQRTTRQSVTGGVQWLDPNEFHPASEGIGSLGRGALSGPGLWGYDFALLKNLSRAERRIQVQFRAEYYNVFNHANLSVPFSQYYRNYNPVEPSLSQVDPSFGRAYYGLNRTFSRFGDLPLENAARVIQLALRFRF